MPRSSVNSGDIVQVPESRGSIYLIMLGGAACYGLGNCMTGT